MNEAMKNKEFVLEYLNTLSGKVKTPEILAHYITDQALIEHILFFDGAFPKYEALIEEMIAEGNRVVVRARLIGKHEGQFGDIMPSFRSVDLPFVVTYTIENQKIVSHWLVADQMALMEQLGVEPQAASH
jgi:predicted ester cyclase